MHRLLVVSRPLLVALFAVMPSPAYAWLGWLDELTGPGKFRGDLFVADVVCLGSPPTSSEVAALLSYQFRTLEIARSGLQPGKREPIDVFDDVARWDRRAPAPAEFTAALGELAKDPEFYRQHVEAARRFHRCLPNRANNVVSVQLEYGQWDDHPDKYVGDTDLRSIMAVVYVPIERILTANWNKPLSRSSRWLEVGAGIGAYGMSGDTLRDKDLWRGVVPFRIRLIPSEIFYIGRRDAHRSLDPEYRTDDADGRWRRFLQTFQFKLGFDLVLGTMSRDLFTPEELSRSDKPTEFVGTYGVQFDLGALARSIAGK